MIKNPVIVTLIGAIILLVGFFISPSQKADNEAYNACITRFQGDSADMQSMRARCHEKAFALAMTSTNARDAARAIGTTNQTEVWMNMIQKFAYGFGGVLFVFGLIGLVRQYTAKK